MKTIAVLPFLALAVALIASLSRDCIVDAKSRISAGSIKFGKSKHKSPSYVPVVIGVPSTSVAASTGAGTRSYWCNIPLNAPVPNQSELLPWKAGEQRTIYFRWLNSWQTNTTADFWFNSAVNKRTLVLSNTAGGSDVYLKEGTEFTRSVYNAEAKESPAGFMFRMFGNPICTKPVPEDGLPWIKFDVTLPADTPSGQYTLSVFRATARSGFTLWEPESTSPTFNVASQ